MRLLMWLECNSTYFYSSRDAQKTRCESASRFKNWKRTYAAIALSPNTIGLPKCCRSSASKGETSPTLEATSVPNSQRERGRNKVEGREGMRDSKRRKQKWVKKIERKTNKITALHSSRIYFYYTTALEEFPIWQQSLQIKSLPVICWNRWS